MNGLSFLRIELIERIFPDLFPRGPALGWPRESRHLRDSSSSPPPSLYFSFIERK